MEDVALRSSSHCVAENRFAPFSIVLKDRPQAFLSMTDGNSHCVEDRGPWCWIQLDPQ